MRKLFLPLALLLTAAACTHPTPITQDELQRRTQELMDAVAPGDQTPWKKYIADDAMFYDEKGRTMDKNAMVADVTPMPAGYSGAIKVVNPHSHIEGDTAVFGYDSDEIETIFGQQLHARYHSTDTWMRRNGEWKIIASQVLRYYEDPAEGTADPKKFPDYAGTYELAPGKDHTVLIEAGKLYLQRSDKKEELQTEAGDIYFRPGVEGRIVFRRSADGKVEALLDRRNNEDVVWKKVK